MTAPADFIYYDEAKDKFPHDVPGTIRYAQRLARQGRFAPLYLGLNGSHRYKLAELQAWIVRRLESRRVGPRPASAAVVEAVDEACD